VRLKETCIETIDIKFSVHDISGIAFIITDQTEILFNAALNIYNPTHKGLHWVKIWNINNISVLSHELPLVNSEKSSFILFFLVFNTTFNNIEVLLMEETRTPWENYQST
jgi:hypothetical protein